MSKFNLYSLRFLVGNSLYLCYAISRLTLTELIFLRLYSCDFRQKEKGIIQTFTVRMIP